MKSVKVTHQIDANGKQVTAQNAYEIVIAGLGLEVLPTVDKSSIFEG
jgi:hypothetical protein